MENFFVAGRDVHGDREIGGRPAPAIRFNSKASRSICTLATLLWHLALCPVVAMSQSAVAATDATHQAIEHTWGDWSKVCTTEIDGPQVCQIVQSANKNKTGELVFQTAIGRVPDNNTPFIYLTAPLGIFLPRGISIVIDDNNPITAVVQRCDSNGCLALLALTDEIANLLRVGKEAQIVFAVSAQQNVFVPLSLNGISDALKAL